MEVSSSWKIVTLVFFDETRCCVNQEGSGKHGNCVIVEVVCIQVLLRGG